MGRTSDADERLMTAARDLMWEESYGSVTIDDICARAGVKKGSFYYFFDSKAALAVAAAFASAQFAQHYTIFPWPLAWLIGIAFEWLYLGSLAMSAALRRSRYFRPVNLGGMIVSGSAENTRAINSLASGRPGTMTPSGAPAASNRSFALRVFSSGP